jgi:hypothetical protein
MPILGWLATLCYGAVAFAQKLDLILATQLAVGIMLLGLSFISDVVRPWMKATNFWLSVLTQTSERFINTDATTTGIAAATAGQRCQIKANAEIMTLKWNETVWIPIFEQHYAISEHKIATSENSDHIFCTGFSRYQLQMLQ